MDLCWICLHRRVSESGVFFAVGGVPNQGPRTSVGGVTQAPCV